ncbi:MAG: ATP-binding protein [Methylacidiphilaceae bacterium]|nr:ATP-binding protein [Candidatus Methylacidiphilaceae bacterium]
MLFRVEIENFYSIGPSQVIDLRARAGVKGDAALAPIHVGSRERAPKVVAVFGPNASGKTTFLRAIAFLAWFASDSFRHVPGQLLPFALFRSQRWQHQPARLAIEIGGEPLFPSLTDHRIGPGVYRYELEIVRQESSDIVTREALFFRPDRARKRFRIFERTEKEPLRASRFFPLRGLGRLAKELRSDASILSTYAQFGHETALAFHRALQGVSANLLIFKEDLLPDWLEKQFRLQPELLPACNQEVRRLDLGLAEISVAEGPIAFRHDGLDQSIPWLLESHGTQSFLSSFPLLWRALHEGGWALLDELDASIHPDVLREIFHWFRDPKRNPRNGQLFLTCQNLALLEDLQKEEIVLCEKDADGFSRIFPLADVKNVRRGENFFRSYRSGIYGALPNIG